MPANTSDYALEILEYERLRLRRYIRKVEENQNEFCVGIAHKKEEEQLVSIEDAIAVLFNDQRKRDAEPKEAANADRTTAKA